MEHKQMYGPNRPTTILLLGILEGHSDGMPLSMILANVSSWK
jgi:hypothetical protein